MVLVPRLQRLALCLTLFVPAAPLAFAQAVNEPVTALKPYVVTADRVAESEAATHDAVSTYDNADVESSGAFTVQEFIESLPPGDEDEEVLILINGVETYLSISALTPAMVAAIEVSDSGGMPQYGAHSRGRVINIKLKEDYNGRELGLENSISGHGDAWSRQAMYSGTNMKEKLRIQYGLRFSKQDPVTADARDFSRNQDHRALGGLDFRVPWGELPVIQSSQGFLAGLTDANGAPVSAARVETSPSGAPFFVPVAGSASGQHFFNTSPYLYLTSPSERLSGNVQLSYTASPKLNLSIEASVDTSESLRSGPPPVTPASADTVIPATDNPFGQEIELGLVHTGFGPARQHARAINTGLGFSANGTFANGWRWGSQLGWKRRESDQTLRDLDTGKFSAALRATTPADRFNAFAPAANADLYDRLAVDRVQRTESDETSLRSRLNGPVGDGWGAGPVRVSFGGSANVRSETRQFENVRGLEDGERREDDFRYSVDTSAEVPLIRSEAPWRRRFDTRVNAALSGRTDGGDNRRGSFDVLWSPSKPWVFRVSLGQSTSEPGGGDDEDDVQLAQTLIDRRRDPAIAQNVQVITRRSDLNEGGRSEEREMSLSYEPTWVKGLKFSVEYDESIDRNSSGSTLDPQDVIDNEVLFADRVIRASPTEADLALGQPGTIVTVDTTAAQVAARERTRLDFKVEYRLSNQPLGNLRIAAGARHLLKSTYEIASGTPFLSDRGGPGNRPEWSGDGAISWYRRSWNASTQLRYTGQTPRGTTPAITDLTLSIGYRFLKDFLGDFGKDLSLRASVRNVLRNEPYYADTILGYRGGSAVGRTFVLSARVPL